MTITYQFLSYEKAKRNYTTKMIEHYEGKRALTPFEFKKEADLAKLLSVFFNKNENEIEKDVLIINYQTVFQEEKIKWFLHITPYEVHCLFEDSSEEKKTYKTQINSIRNLYKCYSYLYEEPTLRTKVLLDFGPKLSFEEFEKRNNVLKSF